MTPVTPRMAGGPSAITRRRLLAGGLIGAGAALAGCSVGRAGAGTAKAAPPPLNGRSPDTLVVAVDAAVEDLDPATNLDWAFGLAPVYNTLVGLLGTSPFRTAPQLATSLVPNSDYTTWLCKLRSGVRFTDGTACDAAAVKAAITRTIDLPGGIGYLWYIANPATQIVIVDPVTIRFELGTPRPFFNDELAQEYGFYIASPTACAAHSTGKNDLGHAWLQSHPVGSGPYQLKSLIVGQQATFTRNPHYWGGWAGSHFQQVVALTIPEPSTRQQLMLNGGADINLLTNPEDTVQLEQDPRFVVNTQPTLTMDYIALGQYGPLADPRARIAMNHAFDVSGYINGIQRRTDYFPHGVFPTLLVTADPSIDSFPYDLSAAKQLFDAAGVHSGTSLSYEYYTGFGDQAGAVLQASLAQIGIHLELIEKSYSGFVQDYFSNAPASQRPNMYFFSWWPGYDNPFNYAQPLFTKSGWGAAGGNAGLYYNAQADAMITSMENAIIDDALLAKSRRVQQILSVTDPAWIPVAQEKVGIAFRSDIHGFIANPVYEETFDFYALWRSRTQG
jgi:peptide/nickel transport system substrate-binding protein